MLLNILNVSFMELKTLWENDKSAGYQHFLLFQQRFQTNISSGVKGSHIVVKDKKKKKKWLSVQGILV